MAKIKQHKEVLDNGKIKATFMKKSKEFVNEDSADQWLLQMEGEYLIKRQPYIKHTLALDDIDDGVWTDSFHKSY